MIFGFLQNIGPWQLIIVIVVIGLLFGGKKIPELARSLGKAKGEFKKGLAEGEKEEAEAEEKPAKELEKA
jgi:sec-independent protein translocase protein TatA